MKSRRALVIALLLICALPAHPQAPSEPRFRIDIQDATFTLTNLSEKVLTACTIQLSVSSEVGRSSHIGWDSLIGTRGPHGEPLGPLEPKASLTMNLPHVVGGPFPDDVKVVAGIWEDGETFGEAVWVKALVDMRASLVSAYEQAIALLKEGIEGDWTRQQYLAAMEGKPQSMPFYSIRRTFQANQSLDQRPQRAKNIAQGLLDHFQRALQMLRPQKAPEPVASAAPGQL